MKVDFYQLAGIPVEQVISSLAEKVLALDERLLIVADDEAALARLDRVLWDQGPDSFLPHGLDNGAAQPVFLTLDDERPNAAEVLFLCDGLTETAHDYELICLIFSGADENATTNARAAWTRYKDAGHALTYWQQGERGWEKKA